MTDALSEMNKHGLYPDNLIADGQIHRFKVDGDKGQAGWYIGYENTTADGKFYVFTFGNFKTGQKGVFRSGSGDVNWKITNENLKAQAEKVKELRDGAYQEKALELTDRWDKASSTSTSHPYLTKKGFPIPDSAIKIKGDVLYIPLYQQNSGLIWTFQKIDSRGDKKFERGGKFKGSFHVLDGAINKIYLCEGYATGLTIRFATGSRVMCCFSAANLVDVARELPSGSYVIAADNDCYGEGNIGVEFAEKASAILKAPVVVPNFKDQSKRPTDFNDLMALEGIDAVVTQLTTMEPVEKSQKPDDFYKEYADFFKDHLKSAKKDIIRKKFVIDVDGILQPVLNQLGVIKSHAKSNGLKPSDVEMHLERYIYDQPADLLIDIPEWDGIDRIKDLGQFIKLKTHSWDIFEDAFKEWLANIFRRLYQDRSQNRCIILKGDQGIGKDNLVFNLLGAFGCYYAKFTNNRDERAIWDQVVGNLVVHIEEFDQTGSLGVAFLKDIITRDLVTYRSAFERSNATQKCHGSFISTVNIDAILRDETGNRRFAVFEIDSIDWSYPKDWSPQIVAQAKSLYASGYRADAQTWSTVMAGNSQFEQVDLVPELLNMWDARLGLLTPDDAKNNTFAFNTIQGVISDMSKASGWKQRTILTMLKTNNRSRHARHGTKYVMGEKLSLVPDAITNIDQTSVTPKNITRTVINYAPGNDRSPEGIDHPCDHHLSIGDKVPF